jgi:uncharacterized phage protein (predicted DNA packaging)
MMQEPISLAEAKKHLRVEFEDDDTLIQGLIVAAREYAEGFLNRVLAADDEEEDPPVVKQTWKQAMLLLIGHWYEHRESVTAGASSVVPMGVDALLWTDRNVPIV